MAKGFKAKHFKDYSIVKGNVKVKLNLKQYGEKLQKAKRDLDGQIMNNMKPYMPYQAGTFHQPVYTQLSVSALWQILQAARIRSS